jgi:hypothetical protein
MATQNGMWATTPRHWGLNCPDEGIYDYACQLTYSGEERLQKGIWCHPNLPRSSGSNYNRATGCPTNRRSRAKRRPWNGGERRCSLKTNEAKQGGGGEANWQSGRCWLDTGKGTSVYPKTMVKGNRGGVRVIGGNMAWDGRTRTGNGTRKSEGTSRLDVGFFTWLPLHRQFRTQKEAIHKKGTADTVQPRQIRVGLPDAGRSSRGLPARG